MGRERQRGAPLLDRHSKTTDNLICPRITGSVRGAEYVAFLVNTSTDRRRSGSHLDAFGAMSDPRFVML